MRIRGASKADFHFVDKLFEDQHVEFDARHLEQIIIVEDDKGIIAAGTLVTLLEVAFVTDKSRSRKNRVLALTALMGQVDIEAKTLKYNQVNAFVTNESMLKILKDKFNFIKTKAEQVLVRFVE